MRIRAKFRAVRAAASVALLAAAFAVFAGPGAAQADPVVDISCVGVEEATFDPGLRLFTQDTDITSNIDYEECVSVSAPAITSGSNDSFGEDVPLSCLSILDSFSATQEIVWNTTETSTFSFDYVVSQTGGQTILVETGTITAGKFTGSDAVQTLTGASISLNNCLFAPGVTSNTSVVSLIISH